MAVLDGSAIILEGVAGARENQTFEISLKFLLPSYPHLATSFQCITQIHDSQVKLNNLNFVFY